MCFVLWINIVCVAVYCFLRFQTHDEAATAKQALVEHCNNHAVYRLVGLGLE